MIKENSRIVRRIQVTEKATGLADSAKQYFFEVDRTANKIEIKDAVEKLFDVRVDKVNTMRYSGKRKRVRGQWRMGQRSDWKRAVVTLKDGYKIELA